MRVLKTAFKQFSKKWKLILCKKLLQNKKVKRFLKSGNRFLGKKRNKNKYLEWLPKRFIASIRIKTALMAGILWSCLATSLMAHPHIFIDAKVEIRVDENNQVTKLQQIWHFDPLFSATVLLDFDFNGNRELDEPEFDVLNQTIRASLAEFDFFQSITVNGRTVALAEPDNLETSMRNQELYLTLENRPASPLKLEHGGQYRFTLYDPTFYVAVDFSRDIDITLTGLPDFCSSQMIRPDEENMLSQSLAELSESLNQRDESFFDDPQASLDLARELAPKLEVTCAQ